MTANPKIDLETYKLSIIQLEERWERVVDNPDFSVAGFKYEMDAFGKSITSPVNLENGLYQGRIVFQLYKHLGESAKVGVETGAETEEGFRVPDVWYSSDEQWEVAHTRNFFREAPTLCVEVWSPSNSPEEYETKKALYFQAGAKEVWLCDKHGKMAFFVAGQETQSSGLCPNFPQKITID